MVLLLLIVVLFFCSGASALIYQVLWLRKLGLVFGVTVYAASTVWASFMFGLAVGSLVAGRVADRLRRPLVWFGVAEALIAISALATPHALEWLQTEYARLYPQLPHGFAGMTFVRMAMTLAVLAIPTTLMGATLPLVVKSSYFRTTELGSRMGLLYATNTAGAIAGTLLSGLYLIPQHGVRVAFLSAAAANIVVAVLAIAAGFVVGPRPTPAEPPLTDAASTTVHAAVRRPDTAARHAVLLVFALSGFASLALEVIWFRVIVLLVRPTVYGFAMMLATLLAGIGAGGYLVTPFLRRERNWLLILATVELVLAVAAALSVEMLSLHPAVLKASAASIARVLPDFFSFSLVASLLTILPSSVLLGIAFPIGLRIWTDAAGDTSDQAARRLGLFYSLNLAGSIAGSLAAGFILLPTFGSRTSLLGVSAIALGSGLLLLSHSPGSRRVRTTIAAVAVAAFVSCAMLITDPLDLFLRLRYPDHSVMWREEGVQATVSVNRARDGRTVLTLEGNHQAEDSPGTVHTHRRIGHLPMAVHPTGRDALVIGLGGGATAGAVAIHTGTTVDVVELSSAVVRAAGFFGHINHQVLERPNVHLRVDDGRNYLMVTRKKYDVVTADLILPIHAGSGNLYSAEYFSLVRNALADDGLALQWVWGTDAEYKTIMRTFLGVFPDATLWAGGSLMIGTKRPLILRRSDFDWKMNTRRAALEELGVTSFEKLLDLYVTGPDAMREFVGSGPILSDDQPLVEYFLSLPRDREIDLSTMRREDIRLRVQ